MKVIRPTTYKAHREIPISIFRIPYGCKNRLIQHPLLRRSPQTRTHTLRIQHQGDTGPTYPFQRVGCILLADTECLNMTSQALFLNKIFLPPIPLCAFPFIAYSPFSIPRAVHTQSYHITKEKHLIYSPKRREPRQQTQGQPNLGLSTSNPQSKGFPFSQTTPQHTYAPPTAEVSQRIR